MGDEYLHLYGSVKSFTGELFALFLPRLDKEYCASLVGERAWLLKRKILIAADGATAHRLAEEKIELVKLPAYAPELNRVERFFEQLRSELKFCVFETLDGAEEHLTKTLEKYFRQPELVKSMTLYPHIKHPHLNLN